MNGYPNNTPLYNTGMIFTLLEMDAGSKVNMCLAQSGPQIDMAIFVGFSFLPSTMNWPL